ncbi:hypothetical protein [Janibacter sp. G56]|uniref:hypothetical protein n=1 Tax=Janibacter sp. G56 TaxID=3418717 RepID=UPI003D069407
MSALLLAVRAQDGRANPAAQPTARTSAAGTTRATRLAPKGATFSAHPSGESQVSTSTAPSPVSPMARAR